MALIATVLLSPAVPLWGSPSLSNRVVTVSQLCDPLQPWGQSLVPDLNH